MYYYYYYYYYYYQISLVVYVDGYIIYQLNFLWFVQEEGVSFCCKEDFTPTNVMDKWILSFTQSLISYVREEMASEWGCGKGGYVVGNGHHSLPTKSPIITNSQYIDLYQPSFIDRITFYAPPFSNASTLYEPSSPLTTGHYTPTTWSTAENNAVGKECCGWYRMVWLVKNGVVGIEWCGWYRMVWLVKNGAVGIEWCGW